MKIYIMRHGQAGMNAKTDEQRPLTEQGIEESIHMARWLAPQLGDKLDRVIHSNYLRAKQTWQSICSELPKAGAVEESGDITPYGDPAFVASYLTALAVKHDSILMVSHLPLVGYLVQSLCPAAGAPMFATSGLACIEWQDGKGVLLWLEGPHTIR
ncbi:phosphohistidine phosphatase SixA [Aeromonas hydrophila]|jgi:phosphohistidine phosphatase|uniref:phosphohistidine phosphatase SixA n=1 Tax=Aeromonas hydrophila TaxID=644 RepID=UPI000466648F|nr:phosphohistidine phosphatase SixA [Aeromonas hydrophila]AKA17112.1 phosphohistidine phosphatase [Aeromonas hydrophila]BDC82194.1 phosphohistidine phosphatase SixA [Aeromonas hydrophila]HAT2246704.1 phosphohistidine phosphatase SixA [Aeromonas hydrophila]HAT2382134.1 phosphohistidine phosphatase SixA [Aeromonas hydrophila]HAT2413750.1 phosphohistidine phosphatase SixA [Aeromonas hydrophila]